MVIQPRFVLALAVFSVVFASCGFVSFAIAFPSPDDSGASSLIEHAALPPPADERLRPDLLGEQSLDGVGSVSEQEAASETEPTGIDPWAEAFAESSRLSSEVAKLSKPDYPVALNPQVQLFLDRFTGARREVVTLWVGRAGRYLGMIRDVLKQRGMPEELAYTAMIESGYNPRAVSRMGAKGMWQFMASTARRYGLRVDQWIDERLDPHKSTIAAAAYLRDLYSMFGSWALAQAAYNAGEVKVSRAIRATGSSDFWTLAQTNHLRRETKEFVPQIHAATLIGQDPGRYGFEFTEPEPLPVDTIVVPPSTDLRRLAARSSVSLETLRGLNPVLVRPVTPPGAPWKLVIPAGTLPVVQTALAAPAVTPRRTVVARPPARNAAAEPSATAAAPKVSATPKPATAPKAAAAQKVAAADTIHVVRPRDTVTSIAKRYGVTVGEVMRWNHLEEPSRIQPGDRLRVAAARPSAEHDGQGGFR
jgi:membrane-bound lytic murein transglycosylase D